jgi:anti-sigma factor RsiW
VTHLGRWLSALVDDELDAVERDRILNHLAGCTPCRVEANELRAIKRRMVALGQSAADAATSGRVVQLARMSGSRPSRLAHLAPRLSGPGPVRGWWPRPGSAGLLVAGGSAGAVVIALGLTAFLLGTQRASPAPRVTPAVDAYWLEHSYDIGQVPAATVVQPSSSPLPAPGRQVSHRAGHPAVSPGVPGAMPSASVPASSMSTTSQRHS